MTIPPVVVLLFSYIRGILSIVRFYWGGSVDVRGAFIWVGASSSVLPTFRYLVPPPAAYFPAKESRQSSPGLRARTPRRGEIRSIPFPAKAENCIALLCPSFSPPDPLRWAPAGPPRGGRRWRFVDLQILWLLPAVLASALYTSAIGPSGGYPPCKTCEQFRWRGWSTCRLSDCHLLHDGFGVESVRRETCSLMFLA